MCRTARDRFKAVWLQALDMSEETVWVDKERRIINGEFQSLAVSVHTTSSTFINLLTKFYKELGEPEAVRFVYQDSMVGVVPVAEDHPDSYPVTAQDNTMNMVAFGWAAHELDVGIESGRYRVFEEDGVYAFDLSGGPDYE